MRHRKRNRVFNRPKSARATLIRHLSRSLLLLGSIETTVPKAKEAGRLTERLIQLGMRGNLVSYRRALEILGNSETTSFLFKEVAPLFKNKNRQGGYTRILRNRTRPGDGAELAILELVEKKEKPKPEKKAKFAPPPPRKEEAPAPPKRVEAPKKEKKEKSGGFFANLRKFIKPKDRA